MSHFPDTAFKSAADERGRGQKKKKGRGVRWGEEMKRKKGDEVEDSRKQQYDRKNNGSAGNRKVKRNKRYEPAAEYNKPSDVRPDSLHLTQHNSKYIILHLQLLLCLFLLSLSVVSLNSQMRNVRGRCVRTVFS